MLILLFGGVIHAMASRNFNKEETEGLEQERKIYEKYNYYKFSNVIFYGMWSEIKRFGFGA